ncbi:unnamed protein product, partial [Coregonus sp. 'balchen']
GGYMAAKVSKLDEQFKLDVPRERQKDGACSSIFTGVAIYVNGYTEPSADELRRLMMLHGGQFHVYYSRSKTTHIITTNLPNSKIQELMDQKAVRPEWITDSIKAGHLLSYLQYQLYAKQKGLSFPSVCVHQGQEAAGPIHGHLQPSHSLAVPSLNNHNPAPSLGLPLSRHHTPTSSHSHLHTDNLHPQPIQYNPLAGHLSPTHSLPLPSHLNPQPSHSLPLPSHLNPQPSHSLPSHLNPQPSHSLPLPSHLNPQPSRSHPSHLTPGPSLLRPFSSNHLYSDPGHITHHIPIHGQPKLGCIQPSPSAYTHPQTPGPIPANPSQEHLKPGQAQPPSSLYFSSHLQNSYRELDLRLNGSLLTSYDKTESAKMNGVQEVGGEDPCPVKTPRGVKDPPLTNGHAHPVNVALKPLVLSPNLTRPTPSPDRGLPHTPQSIPPHPDNKSTGVSVYLHLSSPPSKPPIQHDTPRLPQSPPNTPIPPPVSHHRHHAQPANEQRRKPPPPTYQEATAASASRPLDLPPPKPCQSDSPPEKPLPPANPNPSPSTVCLNGRHHNAFTSNPTPLETNSLSVNPIPSNDAPPHRDQQSAKVKTGGIISEFYSHSRLHHISTWRSEFSEYVNTLQSRRRTPGGTTFPGRDRLRRQRREGKTVAVTSNRGPGRVVQRPGVDRQPELQYYQNKYSYPAAYKEVALAMYETLASYSHDIEALSCDEALVDSSALLAELSVTPDELASAIRADVRERTGCSASVGMGSNILLARMATRKAKPNGQYLLRSEEVDDFIRDQTVTSLPGVGRSMGGKLASLGVRSCGDLQQVSLQQLQKEFGPRTGQTLFRFCRGLDDRPVRSEKERKSVSAEMNYNIRFTQVDEVESFLTNLAMEVQKRLQGAGLRGRRVTLKVMVRKAGAPVEPSKSVTLAQLTDSGHLIASEVIKLFHTMRLEVQDLRGVGLQPIPGTSKGEPPPTTHTPNHVGTRLSLSIEVPPPSQEHWCFRSPTSLDRPAPQASYWNCLTSPRLTQRCLQHSPESSKRSCIQHQRNPLLHLKQVGVGRMKRRYKKNANASPAKKGPSPLKRPRPPGNSPAKALPHALRSRDVPNGLKLENGPSTSSLKQDDPETLSKFTPRPEPTLAGACDFTDIRTLLREWVTTISDPMEEDILQVVKYCTDLIDDKDLEKLDLIIKYMKRLMQQSVESVWSMAFDFILDNVQMVLFCYSKPCHLGLRSICKLTR